MAVQGAALRHGLRPHAGQCPCLQNCEVSGRSFLYLCIFTISVALPTPWWELYWLTEQFALSLTSTGRAQKKMQKQKQKWELKPRGSMKHMLRGPNIAEMMHVQVIDEAKNEAMTKQIQVPKMLKAHNIVEVSQVQSTDNCVDVLIIEERGGGSFLIEWRTLLL